MSILLGRHIEGITLNPLEFAMDNNGVLLSFDTEELANSFLLQEGYTQDQIDNSITFLRQE
mgnify:FL=1